VAHPGLIPVAREIFDKHMPTPNQLHVRRDDVQVGRDLLIHPSIGTITREGFYANIDVCVRYLAAWLDGQGCVPIHNLMEDAATAEISRAQLWQWLHTPDQRFDDGDRIDMALFERAIGTVEQRLPRSGLPGQGRLKEAAQLLAELTRGDTLEDFITLPAYGRLDHA